VAVGAGGGVRVAVGLAVGERVGTRVLVACAVDEAVGAWLVQAVISRSRSVEMRAICLIIFGACRAGVIGVS
jgi:hypothetical protein